jgi:serine protease AprX
MKYLWSILLFTAFVINVQAQDKYWVSLSDKNEVSFDPYSYFSPHTIEKRTRFGIPLNDKSDWPLNQKYVDEISMLADSVHFESRWFNSLVIFTNKKQVDTIRKLPFVREILKMEHFIAEPANEPLKEGLSINPDDVELLKNQLESMKGQKFMEEGINGAGIRIAVFDIGFKNVDTNPAFNHLFDHNKILKTYDFVDKDDDVYHYNSHGTQVLSCIAGKWDSIQIGLATGSEFLLARTEKNSEKFSEEENWLAAAEWADKNGADIINSSLGYTFHRYFNDQMDGKTSLVAKAANMAASKGILVVNAAGNSGTDDWYYIGTPADADSVLSIGGISPIRDYHISFSSFGPTSDKRMKPNLVAFGTAVTAKNKGLSKANGTSFASPLVAGFAACAWQNDKRLNNMELFSELERSGHLYPYFDYAHGYGLPQADYFLENEKAKASPTFRFEEKEGFLYVMVDQSHLVHNNSKEKLLFYNFQGSDDVLEEYAVVKVFQEEALKFKIGAIQKGTKINVHFLGYSDHFLIN